MTSKSFSAVKQLPSRETCLLVYAYLWSSSASTLRPRCFATMSSKLSLSSSSSSSFSSSSSSFSGLESGELHSDFGVVGLGDGDLSFGGDFLLVLLCLRSSVVVTVFLDVVVSSKKVVTTP